MDISGTVSAVAYRSVGDMTFVVFVRVAVCCVVAFTLAGCALLPSSGPTRSEVENEQLDRSGSTDRYVVTDITDDTIAVLQRLAPASFAGSFGDRRPAGVLRIGVGDFVQVTVWEGAAGGLFSAPVLDRNSTGARSAVIPEQQVGQDGAITVPFAGRVRVAGNSPAAVERIIVDRLEGQAIQPQALVTVTRHVTNSATVLGEVTTGGRVPLSARGDRVLDVIALAGGVRSAPHETTVRLARDGVVISMPLQAIVQRPSENIMVRPGDVLTVVRQPQTFVAAGATGRNAVVPFDMANANLIEALAAAGGVLDQRGDPEGVYLLRFEPLSVARALHAPQGIRSENGYVRVIYRLNMRDANAYFVGRRFQMRDKDVLYVANAPLNELQKVLQLVNLMTQPVLAGAVVRNSLR